MSTLPAGSYQIVSVGAPTLCATFIADNSTVQVKTNTSDVSQIWVITTSNNQYFIKAAPSVQYAAVGTPNVVDTDIKAQSLPEGWSIEPSNLGSWTIRTPNYNNVWGFTGNSSGTAIKIAGLDPSNANQKWRFVPS